MFKKAISILLAVGMVVSACPFMSGAIVSAEETAEETVAETEDKNKVSEILIDMSADTVYQTYTSRFEDNALVSVSNDIKLNYAYDFIRSEKAELKELPIIAAGSVDFRASDAGRTKTYFYMSDVEKDFNITNGLSLYKTNGSCIKKLLDKQAEVLVEEERTVASGPALDNANELIGILGYGNMVNKICVLKDTGETRYAYDGINYTLNPHTRKAEHISLNGKKLEDSTEVILASESPLIDVADASNGTTLIKQISKSDYRKFIIDYLNEQKWTGSLYDTTDYNWCISTDEEAVYAYESNVDFIINLSDENAFLTPYIGDIYEEYSETDVTTGDAVDDDSLEEDTSSAESQPCYYLFKTGDKISTEFSKPNMVMLCSEEKEYVFEVVLDFIVSSKNSDTTLKLAEGRYKADSQVWKDIKPLTGNTIKITKNGVYTFCAEDKDGHATVRSICIDNIETGILPAPVVNAYSNTSANITGKATPEYTVCFETATGIYKTFANASGDFNYALPSQKAGAIVYVYVEDKDGKTSKKVKIEVARSGPNQPSITSATTKTRVISGNINDSAVYPGVLVNKTTFYLPSNGGLAFYQASPIYNQNYEVKEVDVSVDAEGNYAINLPKTLSSDDTIEVYSFDILNRVSLPATSEVKLVKPKKPTVDETTVNNKVKKVKVFSEENCKITIQMKGKNYTSSNGNYKAKKYAYCYKISVPRTDSGVKLKVFATNEKGNSGTLTVTRKELVPDQPKITYTSSSAGMVKGKIHIVGNENKENTLSNTKTKVFVYSRGKKCKARIDSNGNFTCQSGAIRGARKVEVQAKNLNGSNVKKTISL